jgi:hypothetical protein
MKITFILSSVIIYLLYKLSVSYADAIPWNTLSCWNVTTVCSVAEEIIEELQVYNWKLKDPNVMVYWNNKRIIEIKETRDMLIARYQTEVLNVFPNIKLKKWQGYWLYEKIWENISDKSIILSWMYSHLWSSSGSLQLWQPLWDTLSEVENYKNTINLKWLNYSNLLNNLINWDLLKKSFD